MLQYLVPNLFAQTFFFHFKLKALKTIQCKHKPFLYKVQGTVNLL
jgi:hypothetical protein